MYAVTITPVDGRNAHVANPSRQGLGLDTGHFALETHADEIAATIRDFVAS